MRSDSVYFVPANDDNRLVLQFQKYGIENVHCRIRSCLNSFQLSVFGITINSQQTPCHILGFDILRKNIIIRLLKVDC